MKPKTKKFLKISSSVLIGSAFVGFVVFISNSWNGVVTLSVGGSSAVMPLMNALSNVYHGVDVVTSAGGSGAGINSILNNTKEIGMASKNPGILGSNNEGKWKEINAKTLTIAWDGIALVYKPSNKNDAVIDLNADNFAKLYTVFSGVRELTLGDFLGNGDKTKITPFARSGGSEVSGTADAFFKDSRSEYQDSYYWNEELDDKEQKQIETNLQKGSYGLNVQQTAEANKQAWERAKDGPTGSMVYLSAGFVINNIKQIKAAGFEVATYNGSELITEDGESNVTQGYNWYRPFNLMFSLNVIENNEAIKKFLLWIVDPNNEYEIVEKVIRENGFIPLSKEQKKTMLPTNEQEKEDEKQINWESLFNIGKDKSTSAADWALEYSGAKG